MRGLPLLLGLVVAMGCKKHEQASSPAAGSAAPPPSGAAPSPADAAPAAGLAFDTDPDSQDPGMAAAFDKKVPRLPAISGDRAQIADIDYEPGAPSVPLPMTVAVREVGASRVIESLPLVDDQMVTDAEKAGGSNWPPAPVAKELHTRGAAVLARLRGFHSLDKIELAITSGGDPQPTRIGDVMLSPEAGDDGRLVITLRDAHGRTLHREELQPYQQGTRDVGMDKPVPCNYRPVLDAAYRNPVPPRQLYVRIGYHYSEGCDPSESVFLPFSAEAVDSPELPVTAQFDLVGVNELDRDTVLAPGAAFVGAGVVTDELKLLGVARRAMDYSGHADRDVQVTVSRDRKSAWASVVTRITLLEPNTPGRDVPWRASDVLVKTPKGWRIAALAWTEPVGNAAANARAKSGKLTAQKLDGDPGDQGLRDAFAKLASDGVDATAAARSDLVALGSGPGERTVGGAGFARAWNAAWKGKVAIVSSLGRALPSGTTGWVAATIELAKPGYKLPFTVFAVFDKIDGAWSLVHIQLAVDHP